MRDRQGVWLVRQDEQGFWSRVDGSQHLTPAELADWLEAAYTADPEPSIRHDRHARLVAAIRAGRPTTVRWGGCAVQYPGHEYADPRDRRIEAGRYPAMGPHVLPDPAAGELAAICESLRADAVAAREIADRREVAIADGLLAAIVHLPVWEATPESIRRETEAVEAAWRQAHAETAGLRAVADALEARRDRVCSLDYRVAVETAYAARIAAMA